MAHERVTVTAEVSKEAHELVQSVVKLLRTIKQVTADGFHWGQDVPLILMQNLQSLTEGVNGADKLAGELREDPGCFIRAWGLGGADVVEVFAPHDH